MGGYGSGRTGYRQNANECRFLDVNHLNRKGYLRPGCSGYLSWSRRGENFGRVNFRMEAVRLVLDFRVKQRGGDWQPVEQPVPLTYANCHYGGERPYFRCPGIVTGGIARAGLASCSARAHTFCAVIATSSAMPAKLWTDLAGCWNGRTRHARLWVANRAQHIG